MDRVEVLVFEQKKEKKKKTYKKNWFVSFWLAKKVLSQLFFIEPGASPAQS